MKCYDYEIMIRKFPGGGLDEAEKSCLFAHLASCAKCRDSFLLFSELGGMPASSREKYPNHLDERILSTIKAREANHCIAVNTPHFQVAHNPLAIYRRPVPAYLLHSAAAAFALILIYLIIQMQMFNSRLDSQQALFMQAIQQVQNQEQQMGQMMDNLQIIRIQAVTDNPSIVKQERSHDEYEIY